MFNSLLPLGWAVLVLPRLQRTQRDGVAAAHDDDDVTQRRGQRPVALQPRDDAAVDGAEGGAARRLHQHPVIVCKDEAKSG